jgi:hypothetical protein
MAFVKHRDEDLFKDGSATEWFSQLTTLAALPSHLNLIKPTHKQISNSHYLLPVKATDDINSMSSF